eukprot:scaffold451543_cov197-Attheya_sp.AAC.2
MLDATRRDATMTTMTRAVSTQNATIRCQRRCVASVLCAHTDGECRQARTAYCVVCGVGINIDQTARDAKRP